MEYSVSEEEKKKRTEWMKKRTRERFKRRIRCEDLYARSRSSSPDVYNKFIEEYRKSQQDKDIEGKEGSVKDKHDEIEKFSDEKQNDSESDEEYGPKPLKNMPSVEFKVNYGSELLQGEGEAIAQYIQKGKRIPRRGEVGLTSEQIENFEKIGYVMSGSRHKAINRMRIKKESMVLTAEQEKAKVMEKYETRLKRENEIVNHFREMISKFQKDMLPNLVKKYEEQGDDAFNM